MTDADFLARLTPPSTPLLVVRRRTLDANIAAMQAACDAAGVALRAHGKMHKCPDLARLQVAGGAVGLCCQTVGEAEAFAAGGIADLLVSAPVPAWGLARLAALAAGGTRLALVADDEGQVDRAGAAAVAAGAALRVLVDLDLGQHRAGVAPAAAGRLAARVAATSGLRYGGIQAYAGHLQHLPTEARTAALDAAAARLAALVADLRAAGLAPATVTGGGSGSHAHDLAGGVFTELQAGSYALMDVEYGDCDLPFAAALFCAATVVSATHKSHVTIDAGLKALSADGPAARVVAGGAPGSRYRAMGDEHGAVLHPAHLGRLAGGDPVAAVDAIDADPAIPFPPDAPRAGGLVWLQPGHVDPTINLHDALWVADEDGRLERWPVAARRTTC